MLSPLGALVTHSCVIINGGGETETAFLVERQAPF